jgi:tetratricopeptide (TPR) repeat protein
VRTKVFAAAICIAFLATCGWFVRAAGPERKFDEGLAALRANQPEETRYCLVSIDHRSDYEAQAALLRGWLRLQSHQAQEPEDYLAIWADLSDALHVRRCRALTLALMGRLLYQGGRLANALNLLDGALAEDPDEIEAHRWLGSALYDVGAAVPALQHLQRVAGQDVSNGRICRLVGLIYRERGDFRDAATAYQQSLTREPGQPDAEQVRLELARCHFALLDYNAALDVLRDCGDTPDVLGLRSLCYVNLGKAEMATECAEQALRADADNVAALNCLAKIDAAGTLERLTRAVGRKPNDFQLRQQLVNALRSLDQEDLANEQERRLQKTLKMRAELDQLLLQANENLFDPALRYRIADLAQRLDLSELAADWRKAARMLEFSPAGDAAPLPTTLPPTIR